MGARIATPGNDPARLSSAGVDGSIRRAIDIHDGEDADAPASKALVCEAIPSDFRQVESSRKRSREGFLFVRLIGSFECQAESMFDDASNPTPSIHRIIIQRIHHRIRQRKRAPERDFPRSPNRRRIIKHRHQRIEVFRRSLAQIRSVGEFDPVAFSR